MKPHTVRYLRMLLPAGLLAAFSLQAQDDSLRHYLSVAAAHNPSVQAARLLGEAARLKLPQAGAYADPTFEAGVFPSPMELAGGRQLAQFQVMQMFPWFGSRKAARAEARHMANMAFEEFREVRDNVLLEVHSRWYALCALRQQLVHSEASLQWIEQLEQLALRRFASPSGSTGSPPTPSGGTAPPSAPAPASGGMNMGGNTTTMPPSPTTMTSTDGGMQGMQGMQGAPAQGMQEVLAIRLEKMEAENRIENLRAEIAAAKAGFNALLNRPPDSPVALPDTLLPLPFLADTESLLRDLERNPMPAMWHEEALAYGAKAEMDRKMGYPMWGVGLQYMPMAPLPAPAAGSMGAGSDMAAMNGKDMLMPMLSVSIPLYRHKYRAARKESLLRQQAGQAKQAGAIARLEAELRQALYLLEEARRKTDLCRRQTALTHQAGSLATQEFVSGRAGLDGVIQIQRRLLDYRLREAEALAAYNTAVATVWKITANLINE
ncbi:MAG: TolC family protein [Tannerellaceae bacterium]|nr:TolC family protein [Tannerellaceae bacterium]